MNLDKKKELETIKNRLSKAYSMTIEDQKKWTKKIRELEITAAKLEDCIGEHFIDEEGIKILISANKELSEKLSEQRWGEGIKKYFDENPKVNELLNKACKDVDEAFRTKSYTVLKLRLEKYKEIFKFVEKTYGDTKTFGARELTQDESKKVEKDLKQVGWV